MKYIIVFFFAAIMGSCSQSSFTKACASSPSAIDKKGTVSGKEIAVSRTKRNSYRNYNRRPHKLGLLRK